MGVTLIHTSNIKFILFNRRVSSPNMAACMFKFGDECVENVTVGSLQSTGLQSTYTLFSKSRSCQDHI